MRCLALSNIRFPADGSGLKVPLQNSILYLGLFYVPYKDINYVFYLTSKSAEYSHNSIHLVSLSFVFIFILPQISCFETSKPV